MKSGVTTELIKELEKHDHYKPIVSLWNYYKATETKNTIPKNHLSYHKSIVLSTFNFYHCYEISLVENHKIVPVCFYKLVTGRYILYRVSYVKYTTGGEFVMGIIKVDENSYTNIEEMAIEKFMTMFTNTRTYYSEKDGVIELGEKPISIKESHPLYELKKDDYDKLFDGKYYINGIYHAKYTATIDIPKGSNFKAHPEYKLVLEHIFFGSAFMDCEIPVYMNIGVKWNDNHTISDKGNLIEFLYNLFWFKYSTLDLEGIVEKNKQDILDKHTNPYPQLVENLSSPSDTTPNIVNNNDKKGNGMGIITIEEKDKEKEKERKEKERKEKEEKERKEKEEKERIEKEEKLKEKEKELKEKEKQRKEKEEKERIEKEEKERIEKERIEKERKEKERIEKERKEKERIEQERKEKEEEERIKKIQEEEEKVKQQEEKKQLEVIIAKQKAEQQQKEKEEKLKKQEKKQPITLPPKLLPIQPLPTEPQLPIQPLPTEPQLPIQPQPVKNIQVVLVDDHDISEITPELSNMKKRLQSNIKNTGSKGHYQIKLFIGENGNNSDKSEIVFNHVKVHNVNGSMKYVISFTKEITRIYTTNSSLIRRDFIKNECFIGYSIIDKQNGQEIQRMDGIDINITPSSSKSHELVISNNTGFTMFITSETRSTSNDLFKLSLILIDV